VIGFGESDGELQADVLANPGRARPVTRLRSAAVI